MAQDTAQGPVSAHHRPDGLTLAAFGVVVLMIAANPLVVRFTDRALPPFWGAGTRMAAASAVFFAYVALRRSPIPRGRDLGGTVLFGAVQFGVGFGLGYWALVKVPAGVAGVILASVPLFTLIFAALAKVEPLTFRGVSGSLISITGIAVLLGTSAGGKTPWPYLAAMVCFTACLAGGLVIAKSLPRVHPASLNAIGMLVGAVLLLTVSFALGEAKPLPAATITWAVQLYVVLIGSVGLFGLLLFVLRRWTASATSYQTVLSPPVTILLAALLLGEPIGRGLLAGAAIVIVGVYVGVISHWHLPPKLTARSREGAHPRGSA